MPDISTIVGYIVIGLVIVAVLWLLCELSVK